MSKSKNQACPVEEDGDGIFTPIPNSCQRFGCKEHHPKLENVNGFMVCPRCHSSYGKAAGAGGRKSAMPESTGVRALASASGSANPWQLGVASMAENCRSSVAWSRECLKRGDDPNVILDRMDKWLKEIIEQIYSSNDHELSHACRKSGVAKPKDNQ